MSGYANTTNLLVPSNAQTHCVRTAFTASAVPEVLNFQSFSLNNFQFNPQGGYFDNTAGTAPLVVTVSGLGFSFSIPAGRLLPVNFPSPADLTVSITGAGNVNIFWVDYPLILGASDGAAQLVQIEGTTPVSVVGGQVGITGNSPVDKSTVGTVANASTLLLAANDIRESLMIAAPQTAGVWLNMAGGTAAANGSGCILLPAGAIYESSIIVNQNAINYFCATAGLTIAVLEG
jgi:hypothetical protein